MSDDLPDLRRLKDGDEDAWNQVFQRYWVLVVEIARRQGGAILKEEDFEDISQEVFLKLIQELKKPYLVFNVKGWLMGHARFQTIDAVRKILRAPRLKSLEEFMEESGDQFASPVPNQLSVAEVQDVAKDLQVSHPRLDELTALLLVEKLCNLEKNPDLAEKHGLAVGAVATRLSRGLSEIRRRSEDE